MSFYHSVPFYLMLFKSFLSQLLVCYRKIIKLINFTSSHFMFSLSLSVSYLLSPCVSCSIFFIPYLVTSTLFTSWIHYCLLRNNLRKYDWFLNFVFVIARLFSALNIMYLSSLLFLLFPPCFQFILKILKKLLYWEDKQPTRISIIWLKYVLKIWKLDYHELKE